MVTLEDISFSYTAHGVPVPVFEHFSATFEEGRITAVIGPSGCGKTTLLRLIAGLLSPQSGNILMQRPRIGFIFQDFGLLPWLTVERNAGLGLEALGIPADERRRRVSDILEELGLSKWRKAYPVRLSGGMQQRVAVARALAIDAGLILMDEPFSSLDALTRESVQDMLRAIQRTHQTTIILVTHSIEEAVYLADTILILDGSMPVKDFMPVQNPHRWEHTPNHPGEQAATFSSQGQRSSELSSSSNPRENAAYLSAVGRLRHAFDEAVAQKAGVATAGQSPAGPSATNPAGRSPASVATLEKAPKGVSGIISTLSPSVSKFLIKTAQIVAAAIFVCVVWWAAAALLKRPFLPSPWLAFAKFSENLHKGIFQIHVLASARRVFLALLVAGPLAWMLGLLAGRVRFFDNFFAPLIYFFHPLPKVAFLPILMLFLGLGDASKVALMALVIFGQLFVTGRDAAKSIAPALLDSVKILGFSRFSIIRLAIVPSTTPSLMSALRVSLGTAIAVLFLSETFASIDGLGWYIMDAWSRVDYPDMYAAILALSLFGLILYLIIDAIEAYLLRWRQNN
ncbi:taurine transporter subunit; ATP-binding component of ABC superfamily (modular protein) [uncultured spirochete]|uniref:Taurine transporter subunit ATP-binding component of ABC superfamily (Modular protein) n=1 Tax=uncultured spirochete TaxID=156406 RepID=A0A3P3XMT9_9SPIR|nr:taurine transporter subunit; ATP-binding component of ABC superfamily (modular protein) [uncultured spirochete]